MSFFCVDQHKVTSFLFSLIQKKPTPYNWVLYTMIELGVPNIYSNGTIFHNIKRKPLLFDHRWYIVQNILLIMMQIKKVVAPFYL